MSFPVSPSLKPHLQSVSVQPSVYFGHKTPPKENDQVIFVEETHDPDIRDKMVKAKGDFMKGVGALSLIAPIPAVILGAASLFNPLVVIGLTVATVAGGSFLLYRAFTKKFREAKTESTERIALQPKAQQLRMEKATGQSLDGLLVNAQGLNQVVVLYLSLGETTVGDAKMFDLKKRLSDLGEKYGTGVRFIQYHLDQPGKDPAFKLPPVDGPASDYPCLAVLNHQGNCVFSETGMLKMTTDELVQQIAPVLLDTPLLIESDDHA